MRAIFTVNALPGPQGSKRAIKNKHTGRVSLIESSAKVKPWREAVISAWQATGHPTLTGPVSVGVTFYLPRPKAHYGTGRNADALKPTAPEWPAVTPDVDKLCRSTLDGLTQAGAIEDDARVVFLTAAKAYVDTDHAAGASISIQQVGT